MKKQKARYPGLDILKTTLFTLMLNTVDPDVLYSKKPSVNILYEELKKIHKEICADQDRTNSLFIFSELSEEDSLKPILEGYPDSIVHSYSDIPLIPIY